MTAKKFIKPEDIERVLENGRRMTLQQIKWRLGLTYTSAVGHTMSNMIAAGRLFRVKENVDGDSAHQVYVYYTSAPAPVAAPYRDMRLTETLSGYDQELNRFAALCMASRRAA